MMYPFLSFLAERRSFIYLDGLPDNWTVVSIERKGAFRLNTSTGTIVVNPDSCAVIRSSCLA
jgi:hypothetical protein